MSYLSLPRISFAGVFEADVNTVNNDVRNYAVNEFEARFQTPQIALPGNKTEYNGWWNPSGSNRFGLIGCAATGAVTSDGAQASPEFLKGLSLEAQYDRTAAKLVDLDPQFQMASGIWGLRVGLVRNGRTLVAGTFYPASFRDLFFGRLIDSSTGQPVPGSGSASARFTGYLDQLVWDDGGIDAPILAALRVSSEKNQGRLTLSLMTYGYSKTGAVALSGSVLVILGTWLNGEPKSFAPGRRFSIANPNQNPFASAFNIGYMNALVSEDGQRLAVDFGNSLPLLLTKAAGGAPIIETQNLGTITLAVCTATDTVASGPGGMTVTPCVTESQTLNSNQYQVIATLSSYPITWLRQNGGVVDFVVPAAARSLIGKHPLLLLLPAKSAGQQVIGIRESYGGLWTRADDFVQRVDSAISGWVSSSIRLWAMVWGKPWPSAPLTISVLPKITGQGGTDDPNEVKPPQVDIPDNNVPGGKVVLQAQNQTGPDGTVTVPYWAADPGNPRRYIDGQVYQLGYSLNVNGQSPMPMFELVIIHVRDAYVPPPVPSWQTDVQPVLAQYGNLYPIMSRGLFSLSDADTVAANARLLQLAFTRPITDSNYMPATRDMSAGKMRMIVDWLRSYLPADAASDYGAIPAVPVGQPLPLAHPAGAPAARHPSRVPNAAAQVAVRALGLGNDGKTAAVRGYLKNAMRSSEEN